MPAGHVVGVGLQIRLWSEVVVVELKLQVVSLRARSIYTRSPEST
jgi:hypothetical protein